MLPDTTQEEAFYSTFTVHYAEKQIVYLERENLLRFEINIVAHFQFFFCSCKGANQIFGSLNIMLYMLYRTFYIRVRPQVCILNALQACHLQENIPNSRIVLAVYDLTSRCQQIQTIHHSAPSPILSTPMARLIMLENTLQGKE